MEFQNLTHRIILHYAIAIGCVLVVVLNIIPDLRTSVLVAVVGWLALCVAGSLSIRHEARTHGRKIFNIVLDFRNLHRRSGGESSGR